MSTAKPTRYRLLKDLPGTRQGTVFALYEDMGVYDVEDGGGSTDYPRYRKNIVENNPDWFAPLSDDPPYPWQPKDLETYWHSSAPDTQANQTTNQNYTWDKNMIHAAHAYRTKEDAERRLAVEPLVNAAVKARLNRKAHVAARHCHVLWDGRLRDFFVGINCDSPCIGVLANNQQDARAIASLFNFFLDPPHVD